MADVVAIIPARYASTRLPGKPLADIAGRPMIQHVYERAARARGVARALVATDDERMASLMTPIRDDAEYRNPNVVKVVTRADGCALYFSRSPLPFWRGDRNAVPFGRRHIITSPPFTWIVWPVT